MRYAVKEGSEYVEIVKVLDHYRSIKECKSYGNTRTFTCEDVAYYVRCSWPDRRSAEPHSRQVAEKAASILGQNGKATIVRILSHVHVIDARAETHARRA